MSATCAAARDRREEEDEDEARSRCPCSSTAAKAPCLSAAAPDCAAEDSRLLPPDDLQYGPEHTFAKARLLQSAVQSVLHKAFLLQSVSGTQAPPGCGDGGEGIGAGRGEGIGAGRGEGIGAG